MLQVAIEHSALQKLLNDYNGKDYPLDSIDVVSAGERDPDADGAEGMSASKMRAPLKEILILKVVLLQDPKTCKNDVHKSKTRNGHYRRRCSTN